ncbi:MAG: hypothetical protein H0V66_02550 [Bdellovibrionales bacterium]|nr:hypothetical protein [Bdellovibrionales bacterium]
MKKWIFSLSVLLCASISNSHEVSHNHNQHQHAQELTVAPKMLKSTDARYVEPYTVPTGHLAVKGMDIKGFDSASLEKLEKAFAALEKVVNSEEFKNRVLNFVNTQGKNQFASNKGLTNAEIYARFMDGREDLQQNTPGEMNFFLKLYYKRYSKVIGWTSGDINTININWKFFKGYKPHNVASNLAHEWIHKLGFGHKSAQEHDSAPYAIGYIVGQMAERVLKGEELH